MEKKGKHRGVNKQEEYALAKILYVQNGLSMKEIAEKVKVLEKTISRWVHKGGWKTLRAAQLSLPSNTIVRLYDSINAIMELAENEQRPLTAAEADKIVKISASIRNIDKKKDLGLFVMVLEDFVLWLREFDLSKAQEFVDPMNTFLITKAKTLDEN